MKRTLVFMAGLLALAALPVMVQAQAAPATGKIHGQVLNPTGGPQTSGTVALSTDGQSSKLDMPVGSDGSFSGEFTVGTYYLIYRAVETPKDQMVNSIKGVKIIAGETTQQNIDMSRQEFIDKMAPEQRKQLEELKKQNAGETAVIAHLQADLNTALQDETDIKNASKTAEQQLGPGASKADITAKANEIATAKYTDIESLMTADLATRPDEAALWVRLGNAQYGLKKNDEAIASFKKTVELESTSKKPRVDVIGQAQSKLGEIYARSGKLDEASAAYDAAAKIDLKQAGLYLKNETIIYFQMFSAGSQIAGLSEAQAAAADKAIAVIPTDPLPYYLKGNALVQKAVVDPKTSLYVLPDGCADALQKYLELAPTGMFAGEVTGILQAAGQKVVTSYKAPGKK